MTGQRDRQGHVGVREGGQEIARPGHSRCPVPFVRYLPTMAWGIRRGEAAMILGPVFERFINESPISVMSRATIEHALSASALDALFEHTAERGYTRELLFSTTVDLMSLVACGTVPHVQSAYNHLLERFPVTLKCVYEKLQHIEPGVSAELVRQVA